MVDLVAPSLIPNGDVVDVHSRAGSYFVRACHNDAGLKIILLAASFEKCIDNGKDEMFNYLYVRLNYELGNSEFHYVLFPTMAWYVLRNVKRYFLTGEFEIGVYIDQ